MAKKTTKNEASEERVPLPPRGIIRREFGKNLQALLVEKGWNQSELARRATLFMPDKQDFGRDNVSGYARGLRIPGPIHLEALCRALGVTADKLLPHRGAPTGNDIAPPLAATDAGDGLAWLRVNMAVEWQTALKVMAILKKANGDT